jgi:hypothetical protein
MFVSELRSVLNMDLERLLRLRLVVARFGELEPWHWWSTRGQLGPLGTSALRRGFPRTHRFAQARSVFAVAAYRCAEVFDPPGCVTLWRLPEPIEEAFEARWERWLDDLDAWRPFFERLDALTGEDLLGTLRELELMSESEAAACGRLKRSAEGRAVPLSAPFRDDAETVALLAGGFSRGGPGAPAVPYARWEPS